MKHYSVIRILFLIFCCFILKTSLSAQKTWLSESVAKLASVEIIELARLDNDLLYHQSVERSPGYGPRDFAIARDCEVSCHEKGDWEMQSDGYSVWRVRLHSPGAYSLNLSFSSFFLPPSASLFLYDGEGNNVIGPIKNTENKEHGKWWSPIVPGDELVLELHILPGEIGKLKLNIENLNHDFAGLGYVLSESCNLDVICGKENGYTLVERYRDVIRSVGMYTLNGIRQCSGVLMNNVLNDCTPYFLTANHCDITRSNAASVVVYWNFENKNCRTPGSAASGSPGNGMLNQFTTGSRLLANYSPSDFALLLLDNAVDASYDPYFAGWDVDGEVHDSTFSVHHPNSDEKRISFDFDTVQYYADNFFVRVHNWEIGTTEGGSSGAPLFNKKGRIIGQLNGGQASCGNNQFDDFGMLKLSWNGGGTAETGLRFWLDPDNSGQLKLDGRNCSDIVSLSKSRVELCGLYGLMDTVGILIKSGFDQGAYLQLENVPPGVKASLSTDSLRLGQSAKLFIELDPGLDSNALVQFSVNNGQSFSLLQIVVHLDSSVPSKPELLLPVDLSSNLNFDIQFAWITEAPKSELIIALDPEFQQVVRQLSVSGNSSNQAGFDPKTKYYWKVRALNNCGAGAFSKIFSFNTGNIQCLSFPAQDVPIVIRDDDQDTVISVIDILQDATIADVNIRDIIGAHSWISDLSFYIESPSGKQVELLINPCEDENNFFVSFDDESKLVNIDCPVFNEEAYKPLGALSSFDGESSFGAWKLIIIDNAALDGGRLDGWSLELCLNLLNGRFMQLVSEPISLCKKNPSSLSLEFSLSEGYVEPLRFFIGANSFQDIPLAHSIDLLTGNYKAIVNNLSTIEVNEKVYLKIVDSLGRDSVPILFSFPELPPAAVLTEPQNKAERVGLNPLFEWRSVSVDSFRFQLAADSSFVNLIIDTVLVGHSYQFPDELSERTDYYWRVKILTHCEDVLSTSFLFKTDAKVAVIDELLGKVSYWPNPVADRLSIEIAPELFHRGGEIRIFDLSGRGYIRKDLVEKLNQLDLSGIPNGVYLIDLRLDGKSYYDRLVILRD